MSVCVIVVNYETADLSVSAVRQVLFSPHVKSCVCVDNGSVDPGNRSTLERLAVDARVKLIWNTHNVGFGRAVNRALAQVDFDPEVTMVLLLNPDACLSSDSLNLLIEYLNANPRCGAVAPRIETSGVRVQSAGFLPNIRRVLMQNFQLSRLYPFIPAAKGVNLRMVDARPTCPVEWVSGACMLIRKSALNDVGGLSERWFLYAEDQELCERLTRNGYAIMLLNAVGARHVLSAAASRYATTSTLWIDAQRDYYRQRVRYAWNHTAFDWCLAIGFVMRAAVLLVMDLTRRGPDRRHERKRQMRFAGACLRPIDPGVLNRNRATGD